MSAEARRKRYAEDAEYRERTRRQAAEYKARNPDKARAAVRNWHAANNHNAEYKAQWRADNPEKVRRSRQADQMRRRAGGVIDRGCVEMLMRDPCAYCGGRATEVEHITALSRGGDNHWMNLTAACLSCNRRKSTTPLLHFLLRQTETKKETT